MGENKYRRVYHTNSDYSRLRYPYLNIEGGWFEGYGFQRGDEVLISSQSRTGLVVINTRINYTTVLPVPAMVRRRRLGASRFHSVVLVLRGRWFWDFGFAYRDEIEISNPASGVMHIEILRSGREIEAERDELKRLGTEEWQLFKEFLTARRA